MSLLRTRNIRVSFGGPALLDGVDLTIEAKERLCLVGRNGCGKSTLLKVLMGQITIEDGEIERQQGSKIAMLEQELPHNQSGSIYDCVADGLGKAGELVRRYHHLIEKMADDHSPALLAKLETAQHELEAHDGWNLQQQVDATISKLSLDADAAFETLSGGLKRRVLLARALVSEPDLLLLDEPTNHLDISSIEWLEEFLFGYQGTLLFISHDRRFLDKISTRIIDLDRGVLTSWPGTYRNYLQRKQEWLDSETTRQALFDKKLSQEETWIRQGIKARRTRNEGRVRALKKLREVRSSRRVTVGSAKINSQEFERSGKLVVETKDVCYSIDGKQIINDLNTTILRGDKIGIIGPNGVGKTTLLRLLLDQLKPVSGNIHIGTKLEISYFDQSRAQLDEDKSVLDNLSDGSDSVIINGNPRHVISYLQDFLFAPERTRTPVRALSGGERNRLLLAKMFSIPANLLVLDEPTNDLDIDTLDLLEELLAEYTGTVLLVSHDRAFLDDVVTSTLVFEGNGIVNEYVGGYSDWLRQKHSAAKSARSNVRTKKTTAEKPAAQARKLSYQDQRALDALPKEIEALEARKQQLQDKISSPSFYQGNKDDIIETQQALSDLDTELENTYQRWEELEQLRGAE